MGTDSKTAVQPPPSKVAVVSSSKTSKKKKPKTTHHKSKHGKQRSDSSSSESSNDYERSAASSSAKKGPVSKSSRDKSKPSSTNENRHSSKKTSSTKKKPTRSKRDSSDSPVKRNNRSRSRSRSRSKSRSRSHSGRSSDRSSSRDSPSRYRQKNPARRSGSNMVNAYPPMPHPNFVPNMSRRYPPPHAMHPRGGRMMPYVPPGMMPPGASMRNNNGMRRSGGGGGNSPPQSLLGGYRPPPGGNFRGRGGPMANPAYVHNVANVLSLLQQQQQQQQQKPNSHKYNNPNNPNNRFYQQFQDNYKKISSGQKISNLYQASFPVQHIPREMRFNFRLLGRNIFTASDEEEEEKEKEKEREREKQQAAEKRSKRRESSSSSSSPSEDDRRRRDDNDHSESDEEKSAPKGKAKSNVDAKRPMGKRNRKGSSSATNISHPKSGPAAHDLLADPANLSTLLAGIMHGDNPEAIASSLVNAAAAVNSKRERTKKQQEKKVQKFKNYARFQQIQAAAAGVQPQTNPEEVEKKIHGLARRLQMKTIGLHDDYESQGMKRSEGSSGDSDGDRHRSSGSSSDRSKDKDGASDGSTNSQRKSKKSSKKGTKKTNAAGLAIGSSDSEQHRSDGNDSDGSMMNLNEDLKPIGYYVKDRERMLLEMFRCVRGHKLQAILPDGLKTRSLDEIKAKCLDQLDILSKKRIRAILLAQPMTSSSGTEDSTDDDDQDFFTLYPNLKSSLDGPTKNETNENGAAPVAPPTETNKKSLPNSKFRPVQMQAVSETAAANLSAPVVVRGDEDVNDYYESFKHIKKLSTLRRNEQDDDFLPFPDQSGKILQPIGSAGPKFEFKPITSLTHSQQAHLIARRAATRQHHKEQSKDVRQEIDDLLNIEDFVLPSGERPLTSAELPASEQRRYGLPPRLPPRLAAGPPKKGSLGDLLKKKRKASGERSPSPVIDEETLLDRTRRRRRRSHSFSSTGSAQRSRSSSPNERDHRSKDDLDEMNDLSKLLDLNEEDELLLLQIEVEQEERNLRREEKRRRKEEKKVKKLTKKPTEKNPRKDVWKCLDDLLNRIVDDEEEKRTRTKRTFDQTESRDHADDSTKKMKTDEND